MDGSNSETITDEFIRRIESERKEINSAYEHGVCIDLKTVEDLSARTDRYGFIHDRNLPTQLTEEEKLRNDKEKTREKKWLDMLKNWPNYKKSSESKLQERVFKGIPNSIRSRAWYKLLDIDNQKKMQAGVYEKMKNSGRQYSLDLRQIDLDINRTFRDNIAYKTRYCQRQVQLYNVLAAYSIYNTEIGYCQGMSGITALLLMYLSDEESTFWALSELMSNPKYAMHGMFKKDFPKLLRYSNKHDSIISQLLPKVAKKLERSGISAMLYTTKWFLQCYLDALPFSLVLRIWDIYLLKGDNVLIAMSYCIFKVHAKRLKKLDMDTINEFLKNQLPEDFGISDNKTIEYLSECMQELKEAGLSLSSKQQIPADELPSQPFGHVDKITRERIIINQKKQSMDQIVEKFKQTKTSNLSTKYDEDSSDEYGKDDDLNPSTLSDYDKESVLSDLTDSNHSSLHNEDNFHKNSEYNDQSNKNNKTLKNSNDNNSTLKNIEIPSDYYTKKLDEELNSEENFTLNGSPRKNTTRIVYHSKDDIEYIKNSQHGIYTKTSAFKSSPTKVTSKTDYI